jgi:hypothetical protein
VQIEKADETVPSDKEVLRLKRESVCQKIEKNPKCYFADRV